jgi:23S rRNA (adenine2030-N6)-methyltransferase
MNYRHAYHAGNHADVLKHAVLARAIERLATKDKPFAVLDVHAGSGAYDLQSEAASKTGEWLGGIGLMQEAFSSDVEAVLAPYRRVIAGLNQAGSNRYYPGSPDIALQLLRSADRLIANELHPEEAEALRMNYYGEKRLTITQLDGFAAVKQQLPFKERRGLVLIDPPYEAKDEASKVCRMLAEAVKRFETGVVIIWYPVTTEEFVDGLMTGITSLGIGNLLCAELRVKNAHEHSGLSGSGLIIRNAPFGLEEDLRILLPALAQRLGIEGLGRAKQEWLTPKKG